MKTEQDTCFSRENIVIACDCHVIKTFFYKSFFFLLPSGLSNSGTLSSPEVRARLLWCSQIVFLLGSSAGRKASFFGFVLRLLN